MRRARVHQSGELDEDLKYKYRDSFLYEWALKQIRQIDQAAKPIDYLVLIALDTLDAPSLLNRKEELERKLPLLGPRSGPWPRPIVNSCGVFNIASWNRRFPTYPAARLP